MPYISSPVDGARLYYADYRAAVASNSTNIPPFSPAEHQNEIAKSVRNDFTLVFLHGWPFSHEMYAHLILPLSQNYGIRCIALDRRGFGRSEWVGVGNVGEVTYQTFAQDTAAVLQSAAIEGQWCWVAASMGAGESVLAQELMSGSQRDSIKDLARRCKGFVWLGASLPYPLRSEQNPTAPGREVWDSILAGLREDRVGFVRVAIHGVFGTREDMGLKIELPPTKIEYFENIVRQGDALAMERCPMIITSKDFSANLKKLDQKVLVLHGDADQGMPASASAFLIEKLVPDGLCEVKIYTQAAHGLYLTHGGQVLEDLVSFVVSVSNGSA